MKKSLSFLSLCVAILLLSACNSKTCKCYIYNGTSTPYEATEYVSDNEPCSVLDYTRGVQYRTCLEYNERDIDPHDIGQEYKKATNIQ